jgi:hypothetical protein
MFYTMLMCLTINLWKVMGMHPFLWLHMVFWNLYKFSTYHFSLVLLLGDNHVASFIDSMNPVVNNLYISFFDHYNIVWI